MRKWGRHPVANITVACLCMISGDEGEREEAIACLKYFNPLLRRHVCTKIKYSAIGR